MNGKNIHNIFNGHHIAPFYHVHADSVHHQINLMNIVGLQKSDDPVRIADGRDLRR